VVDRRGVHHGKLRRIAATGKGKRELQQPKHEAVKWRIRERWQKVRCCSSRGKSRRF
jgi:hypothetical protein